MDKKAQRIPENIWTKLHLLSHLQNMQKIFANDGKDIFLGT